MFKVFSKGIWAAILVLSMAKASAQEMKVDSYLRVYGIDSNPNQGGQIFLQDAAATNPQFTTCTISISNGVTGNLYDLFIHGQGADVNRYMKITNGMPDRTFSMILGGGIEFLEIESEDFWGAGFYLNTDHAIHVVDLNHNDTVLSTHVPPEAKLEGQFAQSSFADTDYVLPFSFTHQNDLIGKGQVIDMAKLVRYVESKLIEEQGEEQGRIVYTYDLPAEKRTTLNEFRDRRREKLQENIETQAHWEKAPIGADGRIPGQAFTLVDEYQAVKREVVEEHKEIDFLTERLVSVPHARTVVENVPTGRRVKTLKPCYRMINGELYYSAEIDDLDTTLADDSNFNPPDWIMNRVSQ